MTFPEPQPIPPSAAIEEPEVQSGFLEAATAAIRFGWAVFPLHGIRMDDAGTLTCTCGTPSCTNPGKHPRTRHGHLDATRDEPTIRRWAETLPGSNLALATGTASSFDGFQLLVIDIDPAKGGTESYNEAIDVMPYTLSVRTGSGGLHLYYLNPITGSSDMIASGAGVRPGIDWRCEGGYVVMPPSRHVTGGFYSFINPEALPTAAPPELLELIRSTPTGRMGGALGTTVSGDVDLQAIIDGDATIPAGNRDETFFRLASMFRARSVTIEDAWAQIIQIHAEQCAQPEGDEYPYSAARAKLESVYNRYPAGATDPLMDPDSDEFKGYMTWIDHVRSIVPDAPRTIIEPFIVPTEASNPEALSTSFHRSDGLVGDAYLAWKLLTVCGTDGRSGEFGVRGFRAGTKGAQVSWARFFPLETGGGVWRISSEHVRDMAINQMPMFCTALQQRAATKEVEEYWEKQSHRFEKATACSQLSVAASALTEIKDERAPGEVFDHNPYLISTPSGVVDLRTGHHEVTRPSHLTAKVTKGSYLPGIDTADVERLCPQWMSFLMRIQPEPEMRLFLRHMLGMSLFAAEKEETFFLLDGSGANGKSSFVQIVNGVLGDYAGTAPKPVFVSRKDDHPADLATMEGKRFITNGAELKASDTLNDDLIKSLVSLEPMPVRSLYEQFHEMTPTGTLWLITNHLPKIKDVGYGLERRMRRIRFNVRIPEQERQLGLAQAIVAAEADAIITLMVHDAMTWLHGARPYPVPVEAAEDVAEYAQDEDPIIKFVAECLTETEYGSKVGDDFLPTDVVYACYQAWCEFQGLRPGAQKWFEKSLSIPAARRTVAGHQRRVRFCRIAWWPEVQATPIPALSGTPAPTTAMGDGSVS